MWHEHSECHDKTRHICSPLIRDEQNRAVFGCHAQWQNTFRSTVHALVQSAYSNYLSSLLVARPRACGSRSRDGEFVWRNFPPIIFYESRSRRDCRCHIISSWFPFNEQARHSRNEIPRGPSQQRLHTLTESNTVIITSDPYSGGSVFDSHPLCVLPTFHPCKCWNCHSWTPFTFRFYASFIVIVIWILQA